MIKKFFYILFIYFLLIFKSFSTEFIGVIGVAVGEITNQNNEKLLSGSKIFYGDTIVVKPKSNAQILFLDETVMTVGESTELTIDDFIYDPKTSDATVTGASDELRPIDAAADRLSLMHLCRCRPCKRSAHRMGNRVER